VRLAASSPAAAAIEATTVSCFSAGTFAAGSAFEGNLLHLMSLLEARDPAVTTAAATSPSSTASLLMLSVASRQVSSCPGSNSTVL
jgi:hypothetical protein